MESPGEGADAVGYNFRASIARHEDRVMVVCYLLPVQAVPDCAELPAGLGYNLTTARYGSVAIRRPAL